MSIIKGLWKAPNHLREHQVMFDSLIKLLSDLDNSANPKVNPDNILPRKEDGNIQWEEVSVGFLIQWATLNSTKLSHTHLEIKDVDSPII
jgi:hypothetical protein